MERTSLTVLCLVSVLGLGSCAGEKQEQIGDHDQLQDCEQGSDCDPDQDRDRDRDGSGGGGNNGGGGKN